MHGDYRHDNVVVEATGGRITGVLDWDERLMALFGYDDSSFDRTLAGFTARLHPDDRAEVTAALQSATPGARSRCPSVTW